MEKQSPPPFLSVVIPARNEERRLPPNLRKTADFLQKLPCDSEILVVENGSSDKTAALAEEFVAQEPRTADAPVVRLLHSGRGKGAAVRKGMLAASGRLRFFCDADFSMPVGEISKFLTEAERIEQGGVRTDFILIGSRELPGSARLGEPFYRRLMGRVFNALARRMFGFNIRDTQCGFKCFTQTAAEVIFSRQQADGWEFDVEILHIAGLHKIPVVEIPIEWHYDADSRVSPLRDTFNMFRGLLKIRQNARAGVYAAAETPGNGV